MADETNPVQPTVTPPAPSAAEGSDEAAAAAAAAAQQAAEQATQAAQSQQARKRQAKRRQGVNWVVPFAVGVVVTVALQLAIANVVAADTYFYRLFRPPGGWVMSIVPALIVFALVWTLTDLALKYNIGRANESDLERREIKQLPRLVAQEPTGVTQRRLLALDGSDRPVAQRLLWLLYYLEHNDDAQRTHELLRHQSDLDADTAAAGYRTVKLFIWAMPILGFVGTVLGISLAVGGFSEFLTTTLDIDDVSSVTSELGNVASGLSFAFDTTLLGLLAGLVANVFSSGVQKRDENFFTKLDELGLSIVANRRSEPLEKKSITKVTEAQISAEFEKAMKARLDELAALITRTQHLMEGLGQTSAKMSNGLTQSIGTVNQTVEQMGGNLKGVSDTLARSMSGLSERVASSEVHLRTGLASLQDALDRTHHQSLAGAESQASIERAVAQLAASIAEFKNAQDQLAPVLAQLAGPLELRLSPARRPTGGSPEG